MRWRALQAPDDIRAQTSYARSLINDRKFSEAIPILEKVLLRQSDYAPAWLMLGMAQPKTQLFKKLKPIKRALQLKPDDVVLVRIALGELVAREIWDVALQIANYGVQAFPGDQSFALRRVVILQKLGRLEEAAAGLKEVPASARIPYFYSTGLAILRGLNRAEEFEALVDEAVQLWPNYATFKVRKVEALMKKGEREQALRKANALVPIIAGIATLEDDLFIMRKLLSSGLETTVIDRLMVLRRQQMNFLRDRKFHEAERAASEMLRLDPTCALSKTTKARLFIRDGKPEEAEQILKGIGPEDLQMDIEIAHTFRAKALLEQNRVYEAIEDLHQAIPVAEITWLLARAHFMLGEFEESKSYLLETARKGVHSSMRVLAAFSKLSEQGVELPGSVKESLERMHPGQMRIIREIKRDLHWSAPVVSIRDEN